MARKIVVVVFSTLLLAAGSGALVRTMVTHPLWREQTDFGVYLTAAKALAEGRDMYEVALFPVTQIGTVRVSDPYVYSPFLAELLLPLVGVGDAFARYIWIAVSIASLTGTIAMLARGFGHKLAWRWTILLLGVSSVSGIIRLDLYHGQVNLVLMFLITLGVWLCTRQRFILAGLAWGVGLAIKPVLGVLILYLLWKRAWRPASAMIATAFGVLVASFALTWPATVDVGRGWLRALAYDSSIVHNARPDNVSLHGLALRLFGVNPYTHAWIDNVTAGRVLEALAVLGLVAAFVSAVASRGLPDDRDVLLGEVGLVLGLGLGFGPLLESDHLVLLAPGLAGVMCLTRRHWAARDRSATAWLPALLAWAMLVAVCAAPILVTPGVPALNEAWTPLEGPAILWTGLFGLLLLAASLLLARALRLDRRTS